MGARECERCIVFVWPLNALFRQNITGGRRSVYNIYEVAVFGFQIICFIFFKKNSHTPNQTRTQLDIENYFVSLITT